MQIEDYVGIYAGFVSTALLIWEIYKYSTDRKSRMLVTGSFREQAEVYVGGRSGEWQRFFWIEVTNRGNYTRHILKPGFESDILQGERYHSLVDIHDKNKYPYALGPGELYQYYFRADSFDDLKAKGIARIRILVSDTVGKKYYSNWITIK